MEMTVGDRTLEVDYPLAFGDAFSKTLEKRFRYIHLSVATTGRNQEKPLWFKGEMRKMKVRKFLIIVLVALLAIHREKPKITCSVSLQRRRSTISGRL
jgi:hypothetical protein